MYKPFVTQDYYSTMMQQKTQVSTTNFLHVWKAKAENKTVQTQVKIEEMIRLVKANAENKTGNLNYNKYGVRDDKGLVPCNEGEIFVDNFVLGCYVPEFRIEKREYKDVGLTNMLIRKLLKEAGLNSCMVKATSLQKVPTADVDPCSIMTSKSETPKEDTRNKRPIYYLQEYKIACPDEDYNEVMAYLRSQEYTRSKLFMRDIDVTIDCAGSFNRHELINILLMDVSFQLQGADEGADYTILRNEHEVGKNCLTWMENHGMAIRCKLYNKFVQMLETQAVRMKIGNHWKAWVDQIFTRFATARNNASERGLTRCEATFYCGADIPTDDFMKEQLLSIIKRVPNDLVYSTPYRETWKAYCECFVHSLVVIDKIAEEERGIIVYSLNEVTGRVSGKLVTNWTEKEKWCLANLTLSQQLPIDIIEIHPPGRTTDKKAKYRVTMNTYVKESTRGIPFTTRLVGKGPYGKSKHSKLESGCEIMMEEAGLLPNINCIPFLAHTAANKNSKSYLLLHHVEELEPAGIPQKRQQRRKRTIKTVVNESGQLSRQTALGNHSEVIDAVMARQLDKKKSSEIFKSYARAKHGKLSQLELGTYSVVAMKACQQKYGQKFVLLLEVGDGLLPCYSNWDIEEHVSEKFPKKRRQELQKNNVIFLDEEPIAQLTITGRRRNNRGNLVASCTFRFSQAMQDFAGITEEEEQPTAPEVTIEDKTEMPIIPIEEMIPYRDMPSLSTLPKGSTHRVSAIGYIEYYGAKRLIVRLSDDEKQYQAGENLTEQVEKLTPGCKIIVTKYRTNPKTRKKYALCQVEAVSFDTTAQVSNKRKEVDLLDDIELRDEKRMKWS